MFISRIEWYDFDSEEGAYEVSDSQYTVVCFAWKENYSVGDAVDGKLSSFCATEITVSDDCCFVVKRLSFFEHKLTGVLCDNRTTVRIGGIFIELDTEVPHNLSDGTWINVTVSRIDL